MPEPTQQAIKTRILFFCEAVTLAHVARPIVLANALDGEQFDIHVAQHPRYRSLLGEAFYTEHEIDSISPPQFNQALADGTPLYDESTLNAYVEEDLALIAKVQPDIIVGDFRISLGVSAELAGVPLIALSNAYWSPYCRGKYVVPDIPLTRILGPTLGQWLFTLARPVAFALHCGPMKKLRKRRGLPSLGFNLKAVYTHADYTLYADAPGLYDMDPLPENHRFIGPVIWSPQYPRPDWWAELPSDRPIVYITLGSSGPPELLPELLAAVGQLEVTAIVSTAGAAFPKEGTLTTADNIYLAPYLSGEEAVQLASLVICNGGSPTTHQALVEGVPVIGVASNMDQYLNMAMIEKQEAGRCVRGASCTADALAREVLLLLEEPRYAEAAQALAVKLRAADAAAEFCKLVDQIQQSIVAGKLQLPSSHASVSP
ncbi:MAG: UDP:flavonoid glycosyltransferase YjiC (YdhE family) [Halioglobus sp.]|jgi:UDP:flavonoid glycosyltransferase YjiC (YdhE family)